MRIGNHLINLTTTWKGGKIKAPFKIYSCLPKGHILSIAPECESIQAKHFPIPTLVFGNNHRLMVDHTINQNKQDSPKNQTAAKIKDWFAFKKRCLFEHGIYGKGISFPQHLIVPSSIDQSIIDVFEEMLIKKMEFLTKRTYEFASIGSYSPPDNPRSLSRSFDAIKHTLTQQDLLKDKDATIILVLPSHANPKLHNHLKTLFKDGIRSQFLVESYPGNDGKLGLCDFFERVAKQKGASYQLKKGFENRFSSYILNTALGILLVNRQWLYRLDRPLHHDVSIGVDINNRKVGMTLYDGKSGDLIFSFDFSGKTIRDDRHRLEKLPEKIMKSMCYKLLKDGITKLGLQPRSIVIHRDGRAFDTEWSGMKEAIEALQKEGLLSSGINFGILEIYKSSVSMPRVVSRIDGSVKNPAMGSYELINCREAVLVNTGFPASIKGTSKPLLIRLGYGNINLEYALQDIFNLSNLCYAVPDKPQALPLTLKILDDFLVPLAYDVESPGYDQEDEEMIADVSYPEEIKAIGERL